MIAWHLFIPAAVVMAMIPGANQILGMRNAALGGVRYALAGLAGRFLAFSLLIALVVVGLGALLQRSVVVFEIVRWLGIAYLVWLGVTTLLRAGAGREQAMAGSSGYRHVVAARREFITALTNPKALLLFASFLPQFLSVNAPPSAITLLAAAYVAIEALAAMAFIAAGRALRLGGELTTARRRRIDQAAGISFLGFGGYLALAPRTP